MFLIFLYSFKYLDDQQQHVPCRSLRKCPCSKPCKQTHPTDETLILDFIRPRVFFCWRSKENVCSGAFLIFRATPNFFDALWKIPSDDWGYPHWGKPPNLPTRWASRIRGENAWSNQGEAVEPWSRGTNMGGGWLSHGGTDYNGWFIWKKITFSKMDENWGVPKWLRKPPYVVETTNLQILIECNSWTPLPLSTCRPVYRGLGWRKKKYRNPLYIFVLYWDVKKLVSCGFSCKPVYWFSWWNGCVWKWFTPNSQGVSSFVLLKPLKSRKLWVYSILDSPISATYLKTRNVVHS